MENAQREAHSLFFLLIHSPLKMVVPTRSEGSRRNGPQRPATARGAGSSRRGGKRVGGRGKGPPPGRVSRSPSGRVLVLEGAVKSDADLVEDRRVDEGNTDSNYDAELEPGEDSAEYITERDRGGDMEEKVQLPPAGR